MIFCHTRYQQLHIPNNPDVHQHDLIGFRIHETGRGVVMTLQGNHNLWDRGGGKQIMSGDALNDQVLRQAKSDRLENVHHRIDTSSTSQMKLLHQSR